MNATREASCSGRARAMMRARGPKAASGNPTAKICTGLTGYSFLGFLAQPDGPVTRAVVARPLRARSGTARARARPPRDACVRARFGFLSRQARCQTAATQRRLQPWRATRTRRCRKRRCASRCAVRRVQATLRRSNLPPAAPRADTAALHRPPNRRLLRPATPRLQLCRRMRRSAPRAKRWLRRQPRGTRAQRSQRRTPTRRS